MNDRTMRMVKKVDQPQSEEKEVENIKIGDESTNTDAIYLLKKILDLKHAANVYKNIPANKVVELVNRIYYHPNDIYIFQQENGNFILTRNWREDTGSDKSLKYVAWLANRPRQVSVGKFFVKKGLESRKEVLDTFKAEFARFQYGKKKDGDAPTITEIQAEFERKIEDYPNSSITVDLVKKSFDNLFFNESIFLLSMDLHEYERKVLQYYFVFNVYGLEMEAKESLKLAVMREIIGISQKKITQAMNHWVDFKTKSEKTVNMIRDYFPNIKDKIIYEFPYISIKIPEDLMDTKSIQTLDRMLNQADPYNTGRHFQFTIDTRSVRNVKTSQVMPRMTKKMAAEIEYIDDNFSPILAGELIGTFATFEKIERAIKSGTKFEIQGVYWCIYPSRKINEESYNKLSDALSIIRDPFGRDSDIFYSSEWKGILSRYDPQELLKKPETDAWMKEWLPSIKLNSFKCFLIERKSRWQTIHHWKEFLKKMEQKHAYWIPKLSGFLVPANLRDKNFVEFDFIRQQRAKTKIED